MEALIIIKEHIEKNLRNQIKVGFTGKIIFQVVLNQGGIRDFETVTTEKMKVNK